MHDWSINSASGISIASVVIETTSNKQHNTTNGVQTHEVSLQAVDSRLAATMADDAKKVAAELVNAKCGIIAFPFYSKLDIDAASGDTAFDREAALLQWQACEGSVLVSTTLGVHGLNYRDVDFIAHLMIPTDIRTYWQAANRACRANQRGRAIQTISAEYIQDASWRVDWSVGKRVAAFREMLRITGDDKSCRRAAILKALGSKPPIAGTCNNCYVCNPENSRNPPESQLRDATKACSALVSSIISRRSAKKSAPFAKTLRGPWRGECSSISEANAAFYHLSGRAILDFDSGAKGGLEVLVNSERAAPIVCCHAPVYIRVTDAPS